MKDETAKEKSVVASIPPDLQEHKDALPAALFYLSIGQASTEDVPPPEELPYSKCKSTRFPLSERAKQCLQDLTPRFGSERKAIIHALQWVKHQSPLQRSLLKTVSLN